MAKLILKNKICDTCGIGFYAKYKNIKNCPEHRRRHSPIKVKICAACKKEFTTYSDQAKRCQHCISNKLYPVGFCAECGAEFKKINSRFSYCTECSKKLHGRVSLYKKIKEIPIICQKIIEPIQSIKEILGIDSIGGQLALVRVSKLC